MRAENCWSAELSGDSARCDFGRLKGKTSCEVPFGPEWSANGMLRSYDESRPPNESCQPKLQVRSFSFIAWLHAAFFNAVLFGSAALLSGHAADLQSPQFLRPISGAAN